MIFTQHFAINFREGGGKNQGPKNDYALILTCTAQVFFSFVLAMGACLLPNPWALLCWVCVGLIIFFRLLTVFLYIYTLVAGKYLRRFYVPSLIFWGWWPFLLFFACIGSAVLGSLLGDYLWTTCLNPYYELRALQMYKGVNPSNVPGVRVQDAGLIEFSNFVEP